MVLKRSRTDGLSSPHFTCTFRASRPNVVTRVGLPIYLAIPQLFLPSPPKTIKQKVIQRRLRLAVVCTSSFLGIEAGQPPANFWLSRHNSLVGCRRLGVAIASSSVHTSIDGWMLHDLLGHP